MAAAMPSPPNVELNAGRLKAYFMYEGATAFKSYCPTLEALSTLIFHWIRLLAAIDNVCRVHCSAW